MKRFLPLACTLLAFAPLATAQINKAPLSPRAVVQQQVGLAEISLDYSRPSVRGREVFGTMEPFGTVWRTGANASTKITFSENVQFGGDDVVAGTYALYTIPEADKWTVILHKNTELWGAGGYDPAEDALRVEVPVQKLTHVQESFTIDFQGFHTNGADLTIAWENTKVSVPVFVDSDARVMAEIDEKVRKASGEIPARTYFDAAMFLFEKKTDLEQASEWLDKAVAMSPEAFWMVYNQAEMALHLGDKDKARTAVKHSIELAKKSPNGDFGYVIKGQTLLEKIDAK